tara:strand:- start:1881 stop:2066 length:186 start_codon:yes stop_codon:yes gene_type:complete
MKKALHRLPLDEWFDDHWMPELGDEPPRAEEEVADNITMHEKMYQIATQNGSTIGGSENNG